MKRISMVVVLSMLVPAVSQASRYSSQRYRIRYSPHAFSYHNNGLIPGGVKYSPYAFKTGNSGLVYEGTRYTPYALNYNNQGLVVDYYLWHAPTCHPPLIHAVAGARYVKQGASPASRGHAYRSRPPARRRYASVSPREIRRIKANDGSQVVKQYLAGRGIANVDTSRRLSVRNQTAGMAFILPERNLVIRYTDPQVVEAFAAESATSRKVLQRYEQRWDAFAKAFEAKGGTIYRINTSDRQQIVAALDNCSRLVPEKAKPQPVRVVAKN